MNLAVVVDKLGRSIEAVELCEQIVKIDESARVYGFWGSRSRIWGAYRKLKRRSAAERDLSRGTRVLWQILVRSLPHRADLPRPQNCLNSRCALIQPISGRSP